MGAYQTGRYERKYLVPEATAAAVRRFVAAYMIPDPYMTPEHRGGYPVHSLYLDSPDFALLRSTTDGIKNRYKLRIRFYDSVDTSPAFLEIKTRYTDTIFKQRSSVAKPVADSFLCGMPLATADLLASDEKSVRALAEFMARHARINAHPAVFVSYRREAYILPHAEGSRVTMDRGLVAHQYDPRLGLKLRDQELARVPDPVVLELKYIGRAPGWMKEMVRIFGLERVSYPKYVRCVNALQIMPAMAG